MVKKSIRFGIIGCGVIADFHARAVLACKGAELAGCCAGRPEKAAEFASKFGIKAYENMEEMLKDKGIDAVCICTPSGMHAEQALAAIRAGKHTIIEKPMCITIEDADRLIEATDKSDVKVSVISQLRTSEAVKKVKAAIDFGCLGEIISCRLSMEYFRSDEYYTSGAWRGTFAMDGGGALINQGIHGIDIMRCLMGAPESVTGIVGTLTHDIEVEDNVAAVIRFRSGAIGIVEGSTSCVPPQPRQLEIRGTKGTILLEEDKIKTWNIPEYGSTGGKFNIEPNTESKSGCSDPAAIPIQGHISQIQDLIDSINEDREPLQTVRTGKEPLEIILSIYKASKTGKVIKI